ncbi:MAG: phenylalanine--tRNA ligase subunit alpha [Candidatus Nanoarchaeia archaeon]|nr:phenylalanine--tRNA ligase subunit alpha [Candidatus Nanoarchaeia archaeon]MDD5588159.1 phenylalanine--tRNA ligase subunit alpha [Candidatus Nanoarchaeia archaeon]
MTKEVNNIIESLNPLERKVLPLLKENKTILRIVADSNLSETEVMRALQLLENKDIIKTNTKEREVIVLDENGVIYSENKLPERRLLELLKSKELTYQELLEKAKKVDLNNEEIQVSIGILKGKAAINFSGKNISIAHNGKSFFEKEMLEERLLDKLKLNLINIKDLSSEEKFALDNLRKRKQIVKIEKIKDKEIVLTELGNKLVNLKLESNMIETLTPEIIKKGTWKGKKFRRYDIKTNVPRVYGAKRHFVNDARNYIKRIWLDLGFKEMTGDIVQTSFWNFDALFVPQDHPAREMQDTFFVEGKKPIENKEIIPRVKAVHENGWTTGSKGWQYKWNIKDAEKLVLRTHTTPLSAKTLANLKKSDLPAKFFAVGKNFRNEALDNSHLFELIQVEGIVVDENANLRNLVGYLKEFFKKMGFEKIRVRPSFFPYTEVSAEVDVYDPIQKKWMEIAGAGIFRPEVTKPLLGFECPVLAWGIGLERTIMNYYNIKDIRELYKNDLKQLKEIKAFIR